MIPVTDVMENDTIVPNNCTRHQQWRLRKPCRYQAAHIVRTSVISVLAVLALNELRSGQQYVIPNYENLMINTGFVTNDSKVELHVATRSSSSSHWFNATSHGVQQQITNTYQDEALHQSSALDESMSPAAPSSSSLSNTIPSIVSETDYTWVGKSYFIPPEGIPMYTFRQMRQYFQDHSVLVLGDSTGRRSYATLYAILNRTTDTASSIAQENSTPHQEGARGGQEIVDEEELDHYSVIDVGKGGRNPDYGCLTHRSQDEFFNNATSNRGRIWKLNNTTDFICRDMPIGVPPTVLSQRTEVDYSRFRYDRINDATNNENSSLLVNKTRALETNISTTALASKIHPELQSHMQTAKHHPQFFDYGKTTCFKHVTRYVYHEMNSYNSRTFNEYDIVVIALGLWDVQRPRYCSDSKYNPKSTPLDLVSQMIHSLHTWTSIESSTTKDSGSSSEEALNHRFHSPTIIVRTAGFDGRDIEMETSLIKKLNNRIVELIDYYNNVLGNKHLMYVDWGTAIEPRSFKESRIEGDMHPHYGLLARTLFAQMLMDKLTRQ